MTGGGSSQTDSDHFIPGTLLDQAQRAQQHALATGALSPIPAVQETVYDHGIPFSVWRLIREGTTRPANRPQPEKPTWSETDTNPFLPYDPAMFVVNLSDTHVCLLNKFNILPCHLLLVTRTFEPQTNWLTWADFEAVCLCMAEFDGLAFYNAGKTAGASQRHKHLQYVPLPLTEDESELPIGPAIASAQWDGSIGTVDTFPFVHALGKIRSDITPGEMQETYRELLTAAGIEPSTDKTQTAPYNLLATREWMLVLPRSRESWAGLSINALGFAGSLLVRDEDQLRNLREIGPLTVLQHVGVTRDV